MYWVIWSNEHSAWWRANSQGYTSNFAQAGRYSESQAKEIARGANRYLDSTLPSNEVAICVVDAYEGEDNVRGA